MRRSASEILRNLETRIARLERKAGRKAINLFSIDRSGKALKHLNKVMSKWISTSTSLKREIYELGLDFYLNEDKIFFDKEDFRLDFQCVIEYVENEEDEDISTGTKHFTIYLNDRFRGTDELYYAILDLGVRDIEEQYVGFDD